MKQFSKYIFLWLVGGVAYFFIEIIYRGYSHWTMLCLGGFCFVFMGLFNEIWSWKMPLWKQMILGGFTTTVLEFITGCIVNLLLNWNIWDYSHLPFNILGQISLPFMLIWCLLSLLGIILDDYIRYLFFNEEKPRYKIF